MVPLETDSEQDGDDEMSDGATFDMESFDDELKEVMKSAQHPACSFRRVTPYRVYLPSFLCLQTLI